MHLTEKDKKKLKFFKKTKKAVKMGLKWWVICFGILVVFATGVFAFYHILESKNSAENVGVSNVGDNKISENKTEESDEKITKLDEKEFERESKKVENINSDVKDSAASSGNFENWNKTCPTELIVVNKDNFLADNYKPKVKTCRGKEVAICACDELDRMISDAKKEGVKLWISSGYRSVELQTKLFKRQIDREKSKAVISQKEAEKRAATVVARPGTSEHNTGLAVDFNGVEDNFYTTNEYKWLTENAHKYGFIERYQKKWKNVTGVIYEPWHFRYVGKDNAEKIKNSGLCLEEYVSKNLM